MKKYRNYLFCIFIIAFIVTSELIGILTLFLPVPIKRRNTDETDLKMGELPYNPAYGNFTYVDNVTQLEYFFNAKEECYILAEVNGTDFTSFKLDNEVCNISYGLNIYPAYFGANFTAHNITVEQSDLDNGTIKWLAVEPLLLKEDNIVVNLSEFYVDTFSAAGPVSLLIQPNFSYNWLYVEVDSMILNNIYNTSDYPEIDSTFLSYFKEEGPYLRFDLNLLPHAHTLKLKGDGFIDYKIVVNYDWDFDGISDVEEIQKELIYTQLDPTIPNIWGFYEKTPDFYSVFNKTGKASGFFRLYIPSTYNGPQYLNIYAETGEISAIAVDDDDLTLRNVTLSKTNQKTPYGVLDSGFHLVYFEFIANKSCKMTFYVDFHEVLVLEKHEFTDSDADGVGDQIERQSGMDAFDTDTDNDGLPDNLDPSPLASLTVEGKNLHQVVFPTNSSKNTIIELIIKKPDPDYTTQTRRLWTPILDIHNGTEIIIQPVLRLFGNQSLTRDDVVIKWKEDYWHYDNFSLVDGYDSESVGDAIPNVRNPNDEYMFIHPKPTNGSYQFSINFPMGHLAKTDGVIDLRFDLLWLVLYYNETRDLNIFHFYPFENDTVIQSMMMKEIGNVSYTIGAPDSMVENEILWALTQNPQLGTPTEFGVADDIVGQGNVDYYDLINHTLSDRLDNPIEVNDTEVLYIAALQSNNDLLNKINISALTTVPFERNHTGDFELYFSFFSISNVYPEGEFNFWDEELKGKAKTCYVIGWHNYTEDQIEAYEKRANLMGFPIDMDLIYFQSSKVLRITQALGVEIPLAEIPNSRNSTLHDKIMLSDQTYIEPSQQVIGIPTLNFNEELHIYKQVFDNRQTNVETSKLVFMDYGYPFSKVFDESYNAFKNTFTDLDNFLNQHFTYSTKIDYSKIWETTLLPTEKIQLIHSFKDYVQDLPDLVLDKEFSGIDFVSFLTFNKKRNSFMGDFLGLSNPILSHFYEFGTEFYSKIKTIKYKTAFNEKVKEARYKSIFKTESRLKRISGAVVGLAKLGWRIYNFVEDLMNFHGSVVSAKELFDNNSIGALEYAGRITLTVGSLVLDGMLVAYGVILLIVKFSEFLMGKVVSFIGKFLGTAIALIGIFLVVVETLFIDIPQLSKLDISSPFLEHELTKLMVSLSFGYMIPLILMATGYSGWGILVGLVVAFIIIPILDYIFWLNQLNSQDIPSLMPNITLSEDPAETYINFDSADLLRSGGLEVGHYTELYYLFNNTGNATISLDLELGYVGGDGNFIWREYDNGNILFPGDTYQNDLSFDLGHPLIGLTLALNVTTEFHDWSVWKPLFNATTLIPLDIPVLQNNIADFYNTTVELPDLDYEGFKATFDDDIENYQYKDASDKLGILTQRVTYDFLEDPPGTFPDEWIFNCTPFCFPHIVPHKAGHNHVLHIYDDYSDARVHMYNNFTGGYSSKTVDFWLYHENYTGDIEIAFKNNDSQTNVKIIFGTDSNIYWGSKDYEHIIKRNCFYSGAWYHIKIDFSVVNWSNSWYRLHFWLNGMPTFNIQAYDLDKTYSKRISQFHIQTTDPDKGSFYLDAIDYSWMWPWHPYRSQFCWNYTLAEIAYYNAAYSNLSVHSNFRQDLDEEVFTINPSVGWVNASFPLISDGTHDPVIDCGITLPNDTPFSIDTPNFTQSLLSNVDLNITLEDPYAFSGIYYFNLDVRINSTKELVFTERIPIQIQLKRDLKSSQANVKYQETINWTYFSWNISTPYYLPGFLNLDIGNVMYLHCQTSTTQPINMNLYNDSELVRSYQIIQFNQCDAAEQILEIIVDGNLTFNNFAFNSSLTGSRHFRLYDLIIINASIPLPGSQPCNPVNLTNHGNIPEYLIFQFSGIPQNYEQILTILPGETRNCLFNLSDPDTTKSNLILRRVRGFDFFDFELYDKYKLYCQYADNFAINGIYAINPRNATHYFYYRENISLELYLNIITQVELAWTAYSLDGAAYVNFSKEAYLPTPESGLHTIHVIGKDASNNSYQSKVRYFTVKLVKIEILSPRNEIHQATEFSGFYRASYGFDSDMEGQFPFGWEGTRAEVINTVANHEKVVQIWPYNGGIIQTDLFPRSFGTIEFWIRFEEVDVWQATYIDITDSPSHFETELNPGENSYSYYESEAYQVLSILVYNDSWQYKYTPGDSHPNNYQPIPSLSLPQANTWHHVKIDFRCFNASSYSGLSEDTYEITIDGTASGELSHVIANKTQYGGIKIGNHNWPIAWPDVWVDAVGFSWDPNYNVGDNLVEGIPVTLLTPRGLEEFGLEYSLNGQNPQPFISNFTIPILAVGNPYSIKIFGTDLPGNSFESNTVFFAISDIQHVVPSGTQVTCSDPVTSITFNFTEVLFEGNFFLSEKTSLPSLTWEVFLGMGAYQYDLIPVSSNYSITHALVYSGPITIGIPYNEEEIQTDETRIRLLNRFGSYWNDITTTIDTINNIIYGELSDLSISYLAIFEIVTDTAPPETFLTLNGTAVFFHGFRSDVQVILNATDEFSNFTTSYQLFTTVPGNWTVYSGPFLVQNDGAYVFWYRSNDTEGNTEPYQEEDIFIDKTAPSTRLVPIDPVQVDESGVWHIRGHLLFRFEISDVFMGTYYLLNYSDYSPDVLGGGEAMVHLFYQIKPSGIPKNDSEFIRWTRYTDALQESPGTYIIYFYSMDAFGNVEQLNTITIQVDGRLTFSSAGFIFIGIGAVAGVSIALFVLKRRQKKSRVTERSRKVEQKAPGKKTSTSKKIARKKTSTSKKIARKKTSASKKVARKKITSKKRRIRRG